MSLLLSLVIVVMLIMFALLGLQHRLLEQFVCLLCNVYHVCLAFILVIIDHFLFA